MEFKKAADVPAASDKTDEELRRDRVSRAVAGRVAKREALRRQGAAEPSSNDLAARLEYRLKNVDQRLAGTQRKARAAVAARKVQRDAS